MKLVLALIVSVLIITSAGSCKHCTTCSKAGVPSTKLCKSDYSDDQYTQAFHQLQANGYRCD